MVLLASLLFLYLASFGLLAWWVVSVLVACWVGLFWLASRWFVRFPARLPWLAVVGFGGWLAAVLISAGRV